MNTAIDSEKIIILDFGSQYTQLIARRIRELGVFSEILSFNTSYKNILKENPRGIIISGGPESVNAKNTLQVDPKILKSKIPFLILEKSLVVDIVNLIIIGISLFLYGLVTFCF